MMMLVRIWGRYPAAERWNSLASVLGWLTAEASKQGGSPELYLRATLLRQAIAKWLEIPWRSHGTDLNQRVREHAFKQDDHEGVPVLA